MEVNASKAIPGIPRIVFSVKRQLYNSSNSFHRLWLSTVCKQEKTRAEVGEFVSLPPSPSLPAIERERRVVGVVVQTRRSPPPLALRLQSLPLLHSREHAELYIYIYRGTLEGAPGMENIINSAMRRDVVERGPDNVRGATLYLIHSVNNHIYRSSPLCRMCYGHSNARPRSNIYRIESLQWEDQSCSSIVIDGRLDPELSILANCCRITVAFE